MEVKQEHINEEKSNASQFFDKILDTLEVKHALIIAVALFLIYNLFSFRLNKMEATKSTLSSKSFHHQDDRFNHTSFYNNDIKDEPLQDLVVFRKLNKKEKQQKKEKPTILKTEQKKEIVKKPISKKPIVVQKKVQPLKKEKKGSNFFVSDKNSNFEKKNNFLEKEIIVKKNKVEKNLAKEIEEDKTVTKEKSFQYFADKKVQNSLKKEKVAEKNSEILTFNDKETEAKQNKLEIEKPRREARKNRIFTFENATNLFKQYQYKQNKNAKNTLLKTKLKNKEFFETEILVEKIDELKLFDGIRFEE